jgi:hypothetical protein
MTHGKRLVRVIGGVVHDDLGAAHTAEEYIEPDRSTFTGLYDHEGTPLHRQREPIGYNPHRWSANMAESPSQKKTRKTKRGR